MSLTNQQKTEAKAKAVAYLEKSIYTLALLCSIDPDDAFAATSLENLIASSAIMAPHDTATTAVFESLFNQITSLNIIK